MKKANAHNNHSCKFTKFRPMIQSIPKSGRLPHDTMIGSDARQIWISSNGRASTDESSDSNKWLAVYISVARYEDAGRWFV